MRRTLYGLSYIGFGYLCLALFPFSATGQILVCDWYSESAQQVVEFNNDGSFNRAFTTPALALQIPSGMALGGGGDLFVSSQGTSQVLRYDWKTGAYAGVFAENLYAPSGLLYDRASNSLYVSIFGNMDGKEIVRYNATTGAEIARFGAGVGGSGRAGLAMDGSGKLYVSDFTGLSISRFDPANNYAGSVFATLPNYHVGINGLAFDRSGHLNVAAMGYLELLPHVVYQLDSSGSIAGTINSGLKFPSGMALDADGNLLVANMGDYSPDSGSVGKYDPSNGTGTANFLTNESTFSPSAVAVEPNAVFWTGGASGSASNSWQNAGNWWRSTPAAGATLCFGAIADGSHLTNDNDFDPLTAFGGITFMREALAYTLNGHAIKLSGPVINQSNANEQTIDFALELVSGGGLFDTGPKDITVGGNISGEGALLKQGSGTLTLSGEVNSAASTTVAAGALVVAGALNSPTITVEDGAQLIAAGITAGTLTIGGAGASSNSLQTVPEPGAFALFAIGALGLFMFPLRRRR
jgi:autotransporter-associated beta strand protein